MDKLYIYRLTYLNNAGYINDRIASALATDSSMARKQINLYYKPYGLKITKFEQLNFPLNLY